MLTEDFSVPTCSRTNTDSVLYLFLTFTRPHDSTRNKYTEDIAYVQEHSQSQYHHQNRVTMFENPSVGAIYPSLTERILIFLLLPRCVGVYINQTTSSSWDYKFFITIYNLCFSRALWVCDVDIVTIEIYCAMKYSSHS